MRNLCNGLLLVALWATSSYQATAATPSPDGTIVPPATQIVDGALNTWTLSNGQVFENGQPTASSSVVEVVYEKGAVYQENNRYQWFVWRNGTWATLYGGTDPLTASPNGKNITVATQSFAEIIDISLNYWQMSKGRVYENGQPTPSSGAVEVYFAGGVIYQKNAHNNWFAWRNGAWVASDDPSVMSPNGATIPTAPLINDSHGNTWTLSKGVAYENGEPTQSSNVTELLFLNGVIYQVNVHKNWYAWNTFAWSATTPPIVESASGTAIPGAMQIVDQALNIWTLSAGQVYENHAPTPSSSVTRVLFSNGTVYQENAHDNWYQWNGTSWVSTSAPSGANPPQYTLTDLGSLGGKSSSAAGINASGQITGSSTLPGDQATHVFIYANGVMKDLGTPDGGTDAAGTGINASGQLSVSTSSGTQWRYSNGTWTNLNPADPAPDQYGSADAINDSGHVTGDTGANGFFYNGTLHLFPSAIENIATGSGINNSDLITGSVTFEPGMRVHGFVYNAVDGSITYLGTFNGADQSGGVAINAGGYTTGWADDGTVPVDPTTSSEGPPHAFLNDAQGLHDLGTLGGTSSGGNAINVNSQVVGSSKLTGDKVAHAFLYTGGAMVDLNTLVSSSSLAPFVTLNTATGINDSGWIIANGIDSRTGATHGYLLKPVTAGP